MGSNMEATCKEISQFSQVDANYYPAYEHMLDNIIPSVQHLLRQEPLNIKNVLENTWTEIPKMLKVCYIYCTCSSSIAL